MDQQSRIALINAQSTAAMIEAMGMVAENQQREIEGKSMAYVEQDFQNLIGIYGIRYNDVVEYLRD